TFVTGLFGSRPAVPAGRRGGSAAVRGAPAPAGSPVRTGRPRRGKPAVCAPHQGHRAGQGHRTRSNRHKRLNLPCTGKKVAKQVRTGTGRLSAFSARRPRGAVRLTPRPRPA